MKRFIIRIRQTRKREWLLVEDFVTAATHTAANALAAARYPRYWVKTKEVVPVEQLNEPETLGRLAISTSTFRSRTVREPNNDFFEDEEQLTKYY